MTGRERVLKAVRHEQPDRVPVGLTSSGFFGREPDGTDALTKFLERTGLKDYDQVLNRLHADVQWVQPWEYHGGRRIHQPDNPYSGALRAVETADELKCVYWPRFDEVWRLRRDEAHRQIRRIRDRQRAVLLYGVADFYEMASEHRGKEQFWMDLLLNPSLAEAILDKFVEMAEQKIRVLLPEFGREVDIIGNCDDFGNQDRLQISPGLFRKFIKPRLKRIIDLERKYTDAFVFHHSCGAVSEIIPDLIDVGVDIINPVQVSAAGMDIEVLKREFGTDICFYGAIDVQQVCRRGTLEEIRMHVRKTVDTLGKDGGYILSPTHAIGSDVAPENVLAIFDTATQTSIQ